MFKFQMPYLLFLIPIVTYLFFKKKSQGSIKLPSVENFKSFSKKSKKHLIGKIFIYLSTLLMIIALARPQNVITGQFIKKDGIDIVISLDLSKSMEQTDFTPSRIEKSKELLKQFIDDRDSDRISLVVFGGEAYTKVPLTFDHNVLKTVISEITTDDITSNNRTAIGMGLGVALNRVKNSTAKSKIIILMTDGENNSGTMSPTGAAKLAKDLGIKVYTIGIGARELVVPGFFGNRYIKNNELDENLLKRIASETGGQYFRASNSEEFRQIFKEIDKLEKTKIDSRNRFDITEYFENILKVAMTLFLIGVFFEFFKYIRIP